MSLSEISVVIPVYNEDKIIIKTIRSLHEILPEDYEIICVYDSDNDRTLPILKKLTETYPRLRTAKNRIACGPSGALRTGFKESTAHRVLVVMADACDDLSQIPQMMKIVPEYAAIACPSRYCRGGRQELDATLKIWLPRTAGFLLRTLSGLQTYDPTNSYKMYSGKLLNEIELESTISFSVTLEIVVKAHCLGRNIVEVPTVWRNRTEGESKFRIAPSIPAYLKWFFLCLSKNKLFKSIPLWLLKNPDQM